MDRADVVSLMESSKSSREWDANCDTVKRAHAGRYPDYWYEAILASGLARRVTTSFGSDPDFHIEVDGAPAFTIKNEQAR